MVTLTPNEAYIFLNAAILGVGVGIIGNWIVGALFRLIPTTRNWSLGLLAIGLIMLGILIAIITPLIEFLKTLS